MKKKKPGKKFGTPEVVKVPKKPDGTVSFDGLINKLMKGKPKGK